MVRSVPGRGSQQCVTGQACDGFSFHYVDGGSNASSLDASGGAASAALLPG